MSRYKLVEGFFAISYHSSLRKKYIILETLVNDLASALAHLFCILINRNAFNKL